MTAIRPVTRPPSMTDKPIFVLCDTNVAVQVAHLFQKQGGPPLVTLLHRLNAKLVVPEVLRTEYIAQFCQVSQTSRNKAKDQLSQLETLCGHQLLNTLPEDKFWEKEALARMEQLTGVILSVPTTDALMLAAGRRAMTGHSPASKKDHGFKDCLIWESLMTLSAGSDILFASKDLAAFFHEGKLVTSLAKEAVEKGFTLQAFNINENGSLYPVVEALKVRCADVDALTMGDLPLVEHPLLATRRPVLVAPLLPRGNSDDAVDGVQSVADTAELATELVEFRKLFESFDVKALGFVSFLGQVGKEKVVALLANAGVPATAARNSLERLTLTAHVRDVGNNYLSVESKLSTMAAVLVEEDMVKLMGQEA